MYSRSIVLYFFLAFFNIVKRESFGLGFGFVGFVGFGCVCVCVYVCMCVCVCVYVSISIALLALQRLVLVSVKSMYLVRMHVALVQASKQAKLKNPVVLEKLYSLR